MDANEVKEKPEEAIARTGMELYELGTRDTGQGEAELDRLLTHLMGLVEDAKTDAAAAKVPTVEDLTAALARGDLVAKARANAKGFAITFHDRAGVEKVTVAPHVDHVPSVPTTLEGAKKGEVTLQAALVQIVEESIAYAKGDLVLLRQILSDHVFTLVRPASETPLVANQKVDWLVSRVMGWLERVNVERVTREDLTALVASLAARKR